ncbi:MAG: microcin transport system substrate-binding protein [Hyphomicrobiales bacterium]|nr:microcin transport system substrate-binding protein [Hyphomicrobiales bacterium]
MKLSRRTLLRSGAAALVIPATGVFPGPNGVARADDKTWRHGLSLFGDLKYPAGFKHFDYVNPNAPKGGVVRLGGFGTFDNFNLVVAGVKGTIAGGLNDVFDTLMVPASDEVSTEYGLLAESASHPADFSSVTYRLRAGAKWHDGKPVTPDDVIFSLQAFQKNHPMLSAYYRHVVKAEQTAERDITFTFDGPGNRELPQIVGQLNVLPKHWWEGTDASSKKRDVTATTLEPLLGNGAYRIKEFVAGRTIVYERVKDYWGKDLNVNIGRDNFDEIRYEYFRDSTVALEAFKGDALDWRTENSAKNWATAYDFPAVKDKRVVQEEFPNRASGRMQGFVLNTRREKFSDPRVRLALNYAFDFEEMNKQLFFGQYQRIGSYFDGTELASSGLPEGKELEILETVRDKVPAEVFTKPYKNPVGGTPENVRANLREATRLLKEGGYEVRNQKLVNAKNGEQFSIEFLTYDPNSERFVLFYKPALERLGIAVSVRTVDEAQYVNRERNWDFDSITTVWGQSLSPGNEQRDYWSTTSADRTGSRNYAGIKNPAVDALIERIIFATDRAELVAATKALDRVLLWNHYVVPQFTYNKTRAARWDRFGRPEKLPEYGSSSFPTIWWWDAERAAKTGSR